MAFDFEGYKRQVTRLRFDDLDFGSFATRPLQSGALRCLGYMHDIEYHTACYLRDLLVTPAHGDPEITAFLSMWAYEELWHGEALAAVLAAHGDSNGADRVARLRSSLGRRDRLRPLVMTLGGWLAGTDFVAVQMAWGAINEAMTQTGYRLLSRRAAHPVLTELLDRIVRQEAMHLGFYTSQARARLSRSRRARRLTRIALSRLWQPVGARVMPPEETRFLIAYLMGDPVSRDYASRIDRRVDSLPGLSGLRLVEQAIGSIVGVAEGPTPSELAA